ncbi:MAG TPA: hypothetical protein VEA37_07915, partial [Flavobacterium sp.]|nr:hypothetical protein [Flavobacterium sp.]
LKNVFFNANLALIYSRYTIPADEIANSKNIDPEYDEKYRPFQGQAPFIINAILSYANPESGIEAALSYNVSGKKLHNISLFATPDIYEESFSLLNFKLAKRFAKYYQVSLTARNLLNNIQLKTHEFNGQQYIAESSIPGRSFGVSIAYQIR